MWYHFSEACILIQFKNGIKLKQTGRVVLFHVVCLFVYLFFTKICTQFMVFKNEIHSAVLEGVLGAVCLKAHSLQSCSFNSIKQNDSVAFNKSNKTSK